MCDESNEKLSAVEKNDKTLWRFWLNFFPSNCHSMKPEPMLMNYEKCDQVIFPLLQKKNRTSRPPTLLSYYYTSLPPFFQSCISDWWKYPSYCTNRKQKIEIVQLQKKSKTLPALPMFYNYYIVNVIIIILSAHKIFCT